MQSSSDAELNAIAIIGAGCRFPGGVTDPESLWQLVHGRVDAVTPIPPTRWDVQKHLDDKLSVPGKMYTNRGGFIEDVELFDAEFFGITPREAQSIDPQQRLLLETAYEALESAAIAPDRLAGTLTGVFVGGPSPDFGYRLQELPVEAQTIYQVNGTGFHAAAGRLSYMFGLAGPSVAIDTACSTSLVAIHLACQSLRTGESDTALAGGANILLGPYGAILFCQGQLLAPDGACKAFDAGANGFVRSEGCAVLVLKRLADAQRDGDPIVGVIRASAVNSDGRSAGLTQPFGPAQEAVVRSALKRAGLQPADIDYVETHGTGTPTGDPIEVLALANVLGQDRDPDRKLVLGSVKTNIGHPEAASGAAGLLKVVMALQHEEIPANLHFSTPNPRFEWDRHPVQVASAPLPWKRDEARPRRAGISSFGFSGTNAHVIVEQAPAAAPRTNAEAPGPCLVPLSARTPSALAALARRHADHLAAHPGTTVADAVLTLSAGREHHRERVAFLAETEAELQAGLRAVADGSLPAAGARSPERRAAAPPRIAFLFTGQGAQYAGMGRDLYEREPIFRAIVDRAAARLDPLLDRPFLDVLFGTEDLIDETAYTQPALYTLEYGLATLWRAWGVTPVALLGHSVGELAAAAVAGVFSFEDGLRLVAARGRLMQALPRDGAMAAVFAPEDDVRTAIADAADRLAIAGINGPDETVISGDRYALEQAIVAFAARGIRSRRLDVSHAFHSPLLDPMLDAFEACAAGIEYAVPEIELLSNVTGQPFPPGVAPDAAYWRRHAREAVRFGPAIDALAARSIDLLVEIGPAPVLLALAARCAPAASWTPVPSLRRAKDGSAADLRQMLTAARELYVRGTALHWAAMPIAKAGRRIRLPTYPFQRVRHWMLDSQRASAPTKRRGHSLLGERQLGPGATIGFLAELSANDPAYLAQHIIHGAAIMPGAGFMETMFAAGRAMGLAQAICLERVLFERPLEFEENRARHVHTSLAPDGEGGYHLTIASAPADVAPADQSWVQHASARLVPGRGRGVNTAPELADARVRVTEPYDIGAYYRDTVDLGVDLGPVFQVIQAEFRRGTTSIARLERQAAPEDLDPLLDIHPTMLDGILQVAGSQAPEGDLGGAFIPLGIDEIVLHRKAPATGWASVQLLEAAGPSGIMRSDLRLEDDDGALVVTVTGLTNQRVAAETMAGGIVTQALTASWEALPAGPARIDALNLVVLSDTAGFAPRLAAAITAGGGKAALAADPADAIAKLTAGATLLDCRALDPADDARAPQDAERAYLALLDLAQALSAKAPTAPLCVVTQGAVVAAPGDEPGVAAAALTGLIRTLLVEQTTGPRLHLDLERGLAPDLRAVFAALATLRPEEPAGALRHGALLLQRLRPMLATPRPDAAERTVLDIAIRGDFDNLRFERRPRLAPAAHEIEIEVRASGLNFRDLVNALGMYPAPVPPLGSECAGIVTAIGSAVTDLRIGDEVVAIAPESFASHCLCPRALAVKKPANVSFAEAVTIPNAYLTAQLCLDVAGLKPGQRILVHAAAGGVGSALVRLAKLTGLEVFATAGNEEKRAWARSRGASHVFDSRTTAFAGQIMAVTNGEGVDLVVNSLAGEFIEAGLRIVRPGGCFVEIGKQGLWTEAEAAAVAPGVRYRVEDLGRELVERPEAFLVRQLELMEWAAQGLIDPLPVRVFPLSAVKDAFRHMAAARHIGKIVLTPDEWAAPLAIRADGTYVVTGGFGGVGLLVVRWLLEKGAGHVAILGRQGAAGHEAVLAELNAGGVRVSALACDVGDRGALAALWRTALPGLKRVRGIFHAAGVLDDAPVELQDAARFTRVKRPKADGAWNLHEVSRGEPLDAFVLFSSTAATFGSPGQANYAAANGFLDGLAASRRYHGLPATSIAWGPWAEVGMAAGMQAQQASWARAGIGLISPESGIAAMDAILSSAASHATVLALNLRLAARSAGPAMQRLLGGKAPAAQRNSEPAARSGASAKLAALKALAEHATRADRQAALAAYLEDEIARVLGFESGSLDVVTPLPELGLDSLMAVQVRNAVIAQLGMDLPVRELLGGSNVTRLAELLAEAWDEAGAPATDGRKEAALVEEGTL